MDCTRVDETEGIEGVRQCALLQGGRTERQTRTIFQAPHVHRIILFVSLHMSFMFYIMSIYVFMYIYGDI